VRRKEIRIILVIVAILLSGCTFHHTKEIADLLNSTNLYSSFGTVPVDLSPYSKCNIPLVINIVNDEKREEDLSISDSGAAKHYINPQKLTAHIVEYMTDALEKSSVKRDQSSRKQIKVSLKKVNWIQGFALYGAFVDVQIEIPEIGFITTYSNEVTSIDNSRSTAYAIHGLTWKMIHDPIVKDYILCVKNLREESTAREGALDILKRRYTSGEISKEQFEQMKRDIQ
jgi:hypothetical protein